MKLGTRVEPRGVASPLTLRHLSKPRSLRRRVIAAAAVLSACGGSEGDQALLDVLVRDSAGLTLIETPAAEWQTAPSRRWSLTLEPIISFLGSEEETSALLHPLLSAVRLNDGRFVAVGENSVVAWFSPTGQFQFKRGGHGGGPDEFQYIGELLHLGGDSVAVVDQGVRVTVFDAEGTRREALRVSGGRIYSISHLQDAWIGWSPSTSAGRRFDDDASMPGYYRPGRALLRHAHAGAPADTLGFFPAEYRRVQTPRVAAAGANLLSAQTPPVLFLSKPSSYAVWNGSVVVGTAEDHRLDVLDASGAPRQVIRWAGEDLSVSSKDHDRWRRALVATTRFSGEMPVDEQRREMAERLKLYAFASKKGAYVALVPDPVGNLWVRRNTLPDEAEAYSVISPDGSWLGYVQMPTRFRVTQIGANFVVGIWADSLDVPHVRVYGLLKP
jgi:hypothetical protein